MKIKQNCTLHITTFDKLPYGATFRYATNPISYYVKVLPDADASKNRLNAVDLDNAQLCTVSIAELVREIDVEVVVYGYK